MNKEGLQLRRLDEDDIVAVFDCGDEDLNDFILTDVPLYYPLSKFDVQVATRLLFFDLASVRSQD